MTEQLKRRGLCHAHIDGDTLEAIFPEEPGAEMSLDNLTAMWSNYYSMRGTPWLIFSGTAIVMKCDCIQESLLGACQKTSPKVTTADIRIQTDAVILTIPDDEAVARLTQREVGSELAHCLTSSEKMTRVLNDTGDDWAARVPTDGRNVKDVALCSLKRAGWID
ncbi:hypothetical protein QQS21_000436 [Conoideocrella luteorostrata]|uniref:Uncharacterized protein n=1 Tax=Conoideocrella luteorostrata TaxID=1105319 RepID=A0AAJ0G408_9HYPO|nr:hypothetical protein QQS21_000436 [Conoideocrella luteorostrata]